MDELDKVIYWQHERIGMQRMQVAVLRWTLANEADLSPAAIDNLFARMEQALCEQAKEKPALAPAVA